MMRGLSSQQKIIRSITIRVDTRPVPGESCEFRLRAGEGFRPVSEVFLKRCSGAAGIIAGVRGITVAPGWYCLKSMSRLGASDLCRPGTIAYDIVLVLELKPVLNATVGEAFYRRNAAAKAAYWSNTTVQAAYQLRVTAAQWVTAHTSPQRRQYGYYLSGRR